jgi:hypothetical protein
MKDLIKEVALEVAEKFFDQEMDADHAARYVEACIAELSKRVEPDYYECGDGDIVNATEAAYMEHKTGVPAVPLFTFPPIHDSEFLAAFKGEK